MYIYRLLLGQPGLAARLPEGRNRTGNKKIFT
jgi:hypothetical protein